MWIGWIIPMIGAVVLIIAIVIIYIIGTKNEKNEKIVDNARNLYIYGRMTDKEYEAIKEKHKQIEGGIDWLITFLLVLAICAIVIGCICGIVHSVKPRHELIQFEETKAIVEQAYENGNGFDNMAITQMVIEKNQWIADVKASLRKYGKWSIYWGFDIDSVEPIILHKQGD